MGRLPEQRNGLPADEKIGDKRGSHGPAGKISSPQAGASLGHTRAATPMKKPAARRT